jgi:hypothetical protein
LRPAYHRRLLLHAGELATWRSWQATFRYRRDRWIHVTESGVVLNVNDQLAVNVTL